MKNRQSIRDISNSHVENNNVCNDGGDHHPSRDHRKEISKSCLIGLSILNVLLFACGIILLAIRMPSSFDLDFDYYGVIIAILTIFVTVLIGWNIYSAVDMLRTVSILKEDFDSYKNEIDIKIAELIDDIQQRHYYSEGKNAVSLMNVFIHVKQFSASSTRPEQTIPPIDYYVIYYGVMGALNAQKSDTYGNVESILNVIVDYLEENNTFSLDKSLLDGVLKMLYKIDSSKYTQAVKVYEKLIKLTIV